MIEWVSVDDRLPEANGEYLCFVRVPRRARGSGVRHAHTRYMALMFEDGAFWINNGAPLGWVTHWATLQPPQGETHARA
jgi:hypothetical protein